MLSLKPIHKTSHRILKHITNDEKKNKYIYYTNKKYKNDINKDFHKEDLECVNYSKLLKTIKKSKISDDEFKKIRKYLIEGTKTLNETTNENIDKVKKIIINNDDEICIKDGNLELLPYNLIYGHRERIITYVSGPSGVGKSHIIGNTVKNLLEYYKKEHNMKKKVIIFSLKKQDKAFDAIKKHCCYISLDDDLELLNDVEILKNSIIIFDDCDVVNKKTDEKIRLIQNLILEVGRSENIDCFLVSHITSNYNKTKVIFNEMHCKIIFPNFMSSHNLKYLLNKLGFGKEDMKRLIKLPSDYVKIIPRYKLIIHEKGAYIYD